MKIYKQITYIFEHEKDENIEKIVRDIKQDIYSLNDKDVEVNQYSTPFDTRLVATLPLTAEEKRQVEYLINKN